MAANGGFWWGLLGGSSRFFWARSSAGKYERRATLTTLGDLHGRGREHPELHDGDGRLAGGNCVFFACQCLRGLPGPRKMRSCSQESARKSITRHRRLRRAVVVILFIGIALLSWRRIYLARWGLAEIFLSNGSVGVTLFSGSVEEFRVDRCSVFACAVNDHVNWLPRIRGWGSPVLDISIPLWLAVVTWTLLEWQLASRGRHALTPPPYCRNCGYTLFGLDTPRCPECGTREIARYVDCRVGQRNKQ